MKEIKLTRGFVALVDDEDFEGLSAFQWHVQLSDNTQYAVRTIPGGTVLMHREILKVGDGFGVDHRDGLGLNNVRSNLHRCTQRQNGGNAFKRKVGSSRFKGVCFYRRYGNWMAYICPDRKKIHLGYFPTEAKAAAAYNFAAMHHFGEFARLNQAA